MADKSLFPNIYENMEEIIIKSIPELIEKNETSIEIAKLEEIINDTEILLRLQSSLSNNKLVKIENLKNKLKKFIENKNGLMLVNRNRLWEIRNTVYSLLATWDMPIYGD